MHIYEITFSPTGGTKKVADLITKAFCQESISVDLTDSTLSFDAFNFTDEDICIISVPSYGGRVPGVAISQLKQMTGGNAKAILVAVYGNRAYEDTLLELRDTLGNAGFNCIAAVAAVAEHSIMHQFATGRPDTKDSEELSTFAKKIWQSIETGNLSENLIIPGNNPYREYDGVPMKPKAGKSCTKCGICAVKCPVNAIATDNPAKTDSEKCISCMRCIDVCPNGARSISKLILTIGAMKMKKVCSIPKKNELFI